MGQWVLVGSWHLSFWLSDSFQFIFGWNGCFDMNPLNTVKGSLHLPWSSQSSSQLAESQSSSVEFLHMSSRFQHVSPKVSTWCLVFKENRDSPRSAALFSPRPTGRVVELRLIIPLWFGGWGARKAGWIVVELIHTSFCFNRFSFVGPVFPRISLGFCRSRCCLDPRVDIDHKKAGNLWLPEAPTKMSSGNDDLLKSSFKNSHVD